MALSFTLPKLLQEELIRLEDLIVLECNKLILVDDVILSIVHKNNIRSSVGALVKAANYYHHDFSINWKYPIHSKENDYNILDFDHDFDVMSTSCPVEHFDIKFNHCLSVYHHIYQNYDTLFPLEEKHIQQIHSMLFDHLPDTDFMSGHYKTKPLSAFVTRFDTNQPLITLQAATPFGEMEVALQDLLAWYNNIIKSNVLIIPIIAEFLARFLAVHPFEEGNGRTSSTLFTLMMLQSVNPNYKKIIHYISFDKFVKKFFNQYLTAGYRTCNQFSLDHTQYHYEHACWFIIKIMYYALQELDYTVGKAIAESTLSMDELAIIQSFENNLYFELTLDDIVNRVHLTHQDVLTIMPTLLLKEFLQKICKGSTIYYKLVF